MHDQQVSLAWCLLSEEFAPFRTEACAFVGDFGANNNNEEKNAKCKRNSVSNFGWQKIGDQKCIGVIWASKIHYSYLF